MGVRFGRAGKTLVASTIGSTFGYSTIGATSFGVFVLPLSAAFQWGRGDISVAFTIMSYTVALLSPFAGMLADRYGVRRVLLPSIAAFGTGLALASFLSGPITNLYALYFFLAIAPLGTTPVIYSRAIVQWFDANRGLALGVSLMGVGIGTAVIPVIVQHAVGAWGWRGAYLSLAVIVLGLTLPVCWAWIYARRPIADQAALPPEPGDTLGEAARTLKYWKLVVGFALLTVFPVGILSHLIPMLQDRGVAVGTAALAASTLGIAIIVGRVVTGYLLDRFFAPRVVIVCMGAAAGGIALLALGITGFWAFFAVALVGFGVGADIDFMAYLVSRYHGTRAYARIVGTVYLAMGLGQGIGPLLMGYSYQVYGAYTLGLIAMCATTLLGILPLATLGPYPRFGDAEERPA